MLLIGTRGVLDCIVVSTGVNAAVRVQGQSSNFNRDCTFLSVLFPSHCSGPFSYSALMFPQ